MGVVKRVQEVTLYRSIYSQTMELLRRQGNNIVETISCSLRDSCRCETRNRGKGFIYCTVTIIKTAV